MADKTTGKLKLWLAKMTDKISDTINIYLSENFSKMFQFLIGKLKT